MNNNSVTVIIPVYNEGDYILKQIAELKKVAAVSEIILVNDKSDHEFTELYRDIQGITLIEHSTNKGKTEAVHSGIKSASNENMLILDGDLHSFDATQIEKAITLSLGHEVVYFIRGGDPDHAKLGGATYITVGEHFVTKSFIEKYEKELFTTARWGFDNNINFVVIKHKIKPLYLEIEGMKHQLKQDKYTFLEGVKRDASMFFTVNIVQYKLLDFFRVRMALQPYITNRIIIQK